MKKRVMLYCEPCGHKQIIEDLDNCKLVAVQRAQIQKHIPVLDEKTNKTVQSKYMDQPKMFKCPSCGRGAAVKELPGSYKGVFDKAEKEEQEKQDRLIMNEEGFVPSPIEAEAKKAIEEAKKKGKSNGKNKHS